MEAELSDEPWHLDRKVPISIIVTLVAQIVGFAWIASKLDSRVAYLEVTDAKHDDALKRLNDDREGTRDRLTRLEVTNQQILELIRKIDARLSKQ